MTQIIGGHNLGLLDGSFTVLNRNDQTGRGIIGHGVQAYANVSNGNVIFQERDIFLPSFGEDFNFVRTYNSRGVPSSDKGWTFSINVSLDKHNDKPASGKPDVTNYTVTYGDGSELEFVFNAARNLWISTDGAGAHETLQVLPKVKDVDERYLVTRADQSQYLFDKDFKLLSVTDANGVATTFEYKGKDVIKISDDTAHVLTLTYAGGKLVTVSDETNAVLVQYAYTQDMLTQVTDRYGHITNYHYNKDKLLDSITLPDSQKVNNVTHSYATRTLTFIYEKVKWDDHPHHETDFDKGDEFVLTQIVDSNGGMTTFEYNFVFGEDVVPNDRDLAFKPNGGRDFQGGTTRVVDALGNARAYSNTAEYVAWRTAHGYYATYTNYDPKTQAAQVAQQNAQAEMIRNAQSVVYTYDANGMITNVKDEFGFETSYTYDFNGNITSVTDANGWGVLHSDSVYYRALRAQFGVKDLAGNGKLVADLNAADIVKLDHFTSRFTYDDNGNLLTKTDNAGNITTYAYTAFNRVATMKLPEGGITSYQYDAHQNLSRKIDGNGNITDYFYDAAGNLTQRMVYTDKANLTDPAKQQITRYFYDAFGNNTRMIDAMGVSTYKTYDHFGNVLTSTDARGNVTTFVYDKDDRLLSMTTTEGATTSFAYDSVGNKISTSDAAGHVVTQVFDRNNMLLSTIDNTSPSDAAKNRTTQYLYDILGGRTQTTDAEGRVTVYAYDVHRQLIDVQTAQVKNANDQSVTYHTQYSYDGESNIVTRRDNNNNLTQYMYNSNGMAFRTTDAAGNVTEILYNGDLKTLRITIGAQLALAMQRVHKFGYDREDRLTTETDALGNTSAYTYDGAGKLISVTDVNAHTTNYEYDRNNRLLCEIRPLVPGQTEGTRYRVTHAYDENGNEVSTTDENGHTTTFAFDKDNRVVLITDANLIQTAFSYDSRDNRTSVAIGVTAHIDASKHVVIDSASHAQVTTFIYDEFNQITSQIDGVGNALVTSDDAVYQQMRREIFGAGDPRILIAGLGAADKTYLLNLFTERYTYDRVGNTLTVTDHKGRVARTAYDALNRVLSETRAVGTTEERTIQFRYDGNGNQVKVVDGMGRVETAKYDALDRLTDRTSALQVTTHNEYDNVSNLLSLTLAYGTANARKAEYLYDLGDRLIQIKDPEGHLTKFEYDAVGNRTKVTDAQGHNIQFFYDALDRNIRMVDPKSFETKFEYDGVGNRIRIIDAKGGITKLEYDFGNRYIQTTDAEGRITKFAYDALDNVISQTTAFGLPEAQTTTYLYDAENNLRRVIDAAGKTSSATFDSVYNLTRSIDKNGHTTTYAFDALNRQIRITDALGGEAAYKLDLEGNVLEEENALHHKRTFTYDAGNRLITEKDANLITTEYSYDEVDNRLSIKRASNTANPILTTFQYDKDNRLVLETDALGHTKRYVYDSNDNVIQSVDQNGHSTFYEYDENDRVTKITDAVGAKTEYSYDGNGNRAQVKDGNGAISTMYYNKDDEVVLTIDGTGAATALTYDGNGNVVQHLEYMTLVGQPVNPDTKPVPVASALDRIMTYAYDALNRLIVQTDALGYQTAIRYDTVGNVLETRRQLSLTDPNKVAVTRFAYDAFDQMVSTLSAEGYLKTYEYDAVGERTKQTEFDNRMLPTASGEAPLTGSGPSRVTLATYDAVGNLITTTSALGHTTRYEYDAVGNRTATIHADGTAAARRNEIHYDAANRITDTVDALGVVTHMVLDAVGNVIEEHEAFGTSAVRVTRYQYDADHRVSLETDTLGVVSAFTYDSVGNLIRRVSALGLANEQRTEQFEYDANGRQTAQVNGEGERTEFTYDAVGNRTMVIVAKGLAEQRINRFRYDGDNRLVGMTDGNGVETRYEYDGAGNKVKTIQLAAVYDSAGNRIDTYLGQSIVGQQRETRFTYDLDDRLTSVTDPLGGVTSYVVDALGNRTRIIDANGTVTENTFDAGGRLVRNWVKSSSHGGIVATNTYDDFGNVTQTRRGFADGTDTRQSTYTYDKRDRRTSITQYDKVDNPGLATVFSQSFSTVFQYDAFGNQARISHGVYLLAPGDAGYDAAKAARAHPLVANFSYDKRDHLTASIDGVGNAVAYTYDTHGNRTSQTTGFGTPDARTVSFGYDKTDRTVRQETGVGGVIKLAYDKAGNQVRKDTLQSGTEAAGVWVTERYGYDGNGRVINLTDGLGVVTKNILDAFGNAIERRQAAGTADERVVRSEYNKNNELTATIDALGKRTAYEYDKLGNRISETDALNHVTRLYYNELNEQIGTLDPEGYLTRFTRDSAGNILQIQIYLQHYAAPSDGRIPPATSPSDAPRTTTNEYDGAGNLVRKTDADLRVREFIFDSAGKVLQSTDYGSSSASALALTYNKAPRVQTFSYDAAGRLTRFVNVDGVVETYAYDTANNRISETITNPNALPGRRNDPVRTTLFEFDAANRQTKQIFDPSGLNQVQTLAYDKAGNVVTKTDARGNTTRSAYDLGNHLVSITDPLSNVTRFTYDGVGNRTSVTDGRGYVTNFEYDLDNRVVRVISPPVDVFTLRDGLRTGVRPTNTSVYDAVGNLVQTIDANGNKITRYYDGNHNVVAELNGDNVLREFTFDAAAARTSATLYMTRLTAAAHNPLIRPGAPTGARRTIISEYDAMSRLVRTTYPAVDVTTLSGIDTDSPTSSTANVTPEQRHFYDAFGSLVESINLAGKHTFAYFDLRGRVVATVDAAGYLIETDFDDQGNLVQQRKYEHRLVGVSAGTKPIAGEAPIAVVDLVYDTANRVIEKLSPEVQLDGARERVSTRFTYDAANNLIASTRAAGTADASTEYFYYDANNRRIALVNSARTLHVFGYDAVGNQTRLTRFITSVPVGIDLSTASLAQVMAAVPSVAAKDQVTVLTFDALNRQVRHADLMGVGDADDIVATTAYDALANVTRRTDAKGFSALVAYDALNHAIQSIAPDGNSSFVEYDAAGLKIRAWTGDLGQVKAQPATNITASISANLNIGWSATGAVQSYVVYGTTAQNAPAGYAFQTARQSGGNASVAISLSGFAAGTQIFFRVVTVDAAGSIAWTEERKLTVPARLTGLEVAASATDLVITARFSGAVANALLNFGPAGSNLTSHVSFVLQADGSYRATISNPPDGGDGLAYQLQWDFGGGTFTTSAINVDAAGTHGAVGQTVSFGIPAGANGTNAANGQFVIVDGVRIANAFQVNGTLQFDPKLSAAGTYTYHVYYGDLVSTQHSVNVGFEDRQSTFVLSDTTTASDRTIVLRWQHDIHTNVSATLSVAEAAKVGVGGVRAQIKPAGAGDIFTTDVALGSSGGGSYAGTVGGLSAGAYDLQVYYVDTDGHKVIVEWVRVNVPAGAALPDDVTVVDSDPPFNFAGQSVTSGGVTATYPFDLSRVVTVGAPVSFSGHSVIVFSTERNGTITRAANGTLSINPGVYAGAVDVSSIGFAVPTDATASAGPGSARQDGLSAGTYFNEYEYNTLGKVIATNEGSGLWRRFGVDVNGDAVETRVYGTRADEIAGKTPIVTFAAFDERGVKYAEFAAATPVAGMSGLQRAVTRATFDYAGQIISRLDPAPGTLAVQFRYDAAGNLISQTDAVGKVTTFAYDRRGNEVKRTDPLGRVRRKQYDAEDRVVRDFDALGNPTDYTYDAFDRVTQITDALSHSRAMSYDQHDRLVQLTSALGLTTRYTYDQLDHRIWTEDANHHFFGQAYDVMGRVVHRYSFQESTALPSVPASLPTTVAEAQDAVDNLGSPFRSLLVDEAIAYDAYGNKIAETDAEGRSRTFTYGAFGRLLSQADEGQRVTTYIFDRFGRLIQETRPIDPTVTGARNIVRSYDDAGRVTSVENVATGMTTSYTYDVAGRRKSEIIVGRNFDGTVGTLRSIAYSYDGAGRMLNWSDAVTAKNLSYEYDDVGNVVRVSGSDGVDHRYTYNSNDCVTRIMQGASTLLAAYAYDARGRRAVYDDGTKTSSYTYDVDDRITRADTSPNATPGDTSDDTHAKWEYDAVGNVTRYQELAANNTTVKYSQSSVFAANNRVIKSDTDDERDPDNKNIVSTTNLLDKSGRVLVETQVNSSDPGDVKTVSYTHTYAADGRELSITATGSGDVTGSTTSTFDADDRLVKLDLGQGDGQDSAEFKQFIYSSDGQILIRFHDDGKNGNTNPITQFLYANGNPVGATGTATDGTTETLLDTEQYNPLQNFDADFPSTSLTDYVVQAGDTLQAIAARLYGDPGLWYVIADANGLKGSEELKAGTRLTIPNTIESGRFTADTHTVYHESDIVGSKLPNLKSPPPSLCAIILAVLLAIIIAIIAIVITIATAGIGSEIGAALIAGEIPTTAALIAGATGGLAGVGLVIGAEAGGLSAGVVLGAVIGGVIGGAVGGALAGFAGSALTQGIQIAFGLQKEFDWKQLAADVAGGVLGGIGGAFSTGAEAIAKVASIATSVARIARIAAVAADTALNVASEAIAQAAVHDGRIDQPWMLAVAGGAVIGGEVLGALGSRALRSEKQVQKAVDNVVAEGSPTGTGKQVRFADETQTISSKTVDDIPVKEHSSIGASVKDLDTEFEAPLICGRDQACCGDTIDSIIANGFVNEAQGLEGADGQIKLELKNASDSVSANNNSAKYEPVDVDDTMASIGSKVQSQSDLDTAVGQRQIVHIKEEMSGQVAAIDRESNTEFAESSVGKVQDNTVSIKSRAPRRADARRGLPARGEAKALFVDAEKPSPPAREFVTTVPRPWREGINPTGASDGLTPSERTLRYAPKPYAESIDRSIGVQPGATLEEYDRHLQDLVKANRAIPAPRDRNAPDFSGGMIDTYEGTVTRHFFLRSYEQEAGDFRKGVTGADKLAKRTDVAKHFMDDRASNLRMEKNPNGTLHEEYDPRGAEIIQKSNWWELAALKGYADVFDTKNKLAEQAAKLDLQYRWSAMREKLELGRQRGAGELRWAVDGADYRYLNGALRDPARNPHVRELFDDYIKVAVEGLNNFDTYTGTLYRGGAYSEMLTQKLTGSGTYTEAAFFSAATLSEPAAQFLRIEKGETVFMINSRGGARNTRSISPAPKEEERTFRPGTRFKVLKIEDHGQKVPTPWGDVQRIIYLDEIVEGKRGW